MDAVEELYIIGCTGMPLEPRQAAQNLVDLAQWASQGELVASSADQYGGATGETADLLTALHRWRGAPGATAGSPGRVERQRMRRAEDGAAHAALSRFYAPQLG